MRIGLVLFLGCAVALGSKKGTEYCALMVACDQELALVDPMYDAVFEGEDDPTYGQGGTCFQGDKDACNSACSSALDGMIQSADEAVEDGRIEAVPTECYPKSGGCW